MEFPEEENWQAAVDLGAELMQPYGLGEGFAVFLVPADTQAGNTGKRISALEDLTASYPDKVLSQSTWPRPAATGAIIRRPPLPSERHMPWANGSPPFC